MIEIKHASNFDKSIVEIQLWRLLSTFVYPYPSTESFHGTCVHSQLVDLIMTIDHNVQTLTAWIHDRQ